MHRLDLRQAAARRKLPSTRLRSRERAYRARCGRTTPELRFTTLRRGCISTRRRSPLPPQDMGQRGAQLDYRAHAGLHEWALMRTLQFTDRIIADLRMEATNPLNHSRIHAWNTVGNCRSSGFRGGQSDAHHAATLRVRF